MDAVDAPWLEQVLMTLLQTPTHVPVGQTAIDPGDPDILRAVDDVVVPMIEELGPEEVRRHPLGEVAARFGPPGDDGVLVQTYLVSQHGNLMDDPLSGKIIEDASLGEGARVGVGQGANQNKGPMAAVLAALHGLPRDLSQPVWLAINTEGRSSHGGSRRIIDDLGIRARWGVVSIGTDLRVSVGNRGRLDVRVTVPGQSCHSSQPWLGDNPIERASDVVRALRSLPLPPSHPDLGSATATPYAFACHPVAPHTIPEDVRMIIDRRLLPGDDRVRVLEELQAHIEATVDGPVQVAPGEYMLPAAVAVEAPIVERLRHHVRELTSRDEPPLWSKNTFDAGLACARGIPTCMFGPGRRDFGAGVTGAETVVIDDCIAAAAALRATFIDLCAVEVEPNPNNTRTLR